MNKRSVLEWLAYGISVVSHPLLIPTYMLILLLLINPYLFGVNSIGEPGGRLILLLVFLYTFFLPVISIVIMRFLGFIQDFHVADKQQRIGPYLITGILYLWVFYNFKENAQIPTAYTAFMLGTVIALFAAFFANIFTKISTHAVGMGGLVAMVIITMLLFSYNTFLLPLPWGEEIRMRVGTLLIFVILAAGLVGSSRLILKAHDPIDLYGGYLIGFTAQLVAVRFFF